MKKPATKSDLEAVKKACRRLAKLEPESDTLAEARSLLRKGGLTHEQARNIKDSVDETAEAYAAEQRPTVFVAFEMEPSQAAESHGYKEFEWHGEVSFEDAHGVVRGNGQDEEKFTPKQTKALKALDADMKGQGWACGGEGGYLEALVGYERVRAGEVDDYRDRWAEKLAGRVAKALKRHFPDHEVEVDKA